MACASCLAFSAIVPHFAPMKRIWQALAVLVWRFRARGFREPSKEIPVLSPVEMTETLDPVWVQLERRARERDENAAKESVAAEWAKGVRFPDADWLLLWQTMSTDDRFGIALSRRMQ